MKADIHPKWFAESVVTCACGNTWTTGATIPEIKTDICSNCHPFYTGEQRIVDTEGRVDIFMRRLQRRNEMQAERESSKTEASVSNELPLAELEISKRYLNILEENSIMTVQDLLTKLSEEGEDAILGLSGIGQKALADMKKALRTKGFELPGA
ncbi:hypothetical protein MASR2M15_16470 [Anaerolineales bacterium]